MYIFIEGHIVLYIIVFLFGLIMKIPFKTIFQKIKEVNTKTQILIILYIILFISIYYCYIN